MQGEGRGTILRRRVPGVPDVVETPLARQLGAGERIADLYVVKRMLGAGGMGVVYLAHQEQWNLDIVLKVPNAEILADTENAHRITTEAEAWIDLGLHPHVAYCYYVHPIDGIPVLVVEYLDGGSLRDWIADGRCADLKVGLELAIQACHGLEHAHAKGLIHRDIKPENILLTHDGVLKITDFGIVRRGPGFDDGTPQVADAVEAHGQTVGLIGTYEYMAPEQFASPREVDARADIFALGVCLYEMVCGRRPYGMATGERQSPPDPRSLRGDLMLPERLCQAMSACVEWQPEHRPTSVAAARLMLCDAYEELFGEASVHAVLPPVSLAADTWDNRAVSCLALGKEKEAEEAWARALELDPFHTSATFNRGLHQWRSGQITDQQLIQRLTECRSRDSDESLTTHFLLQIHRERGDREAASDAPAHSGTEVPLGTGDPVMVSGDGRTIMINRLSHSALDYGTTLLNDVTDGRVIRSWDSRPARGGYQGICLSSDGGVVLLSQTRTRLLRAHSHGLLTLYHVRSGRRLAVLPDKPHVTCGALGPDGQLAVLGNDDGTVTFWQPTSGPAWLNAWRSRKVKAHSRTVACVGLSEDGALALSGSDDRTVRCWDVASGRCMAVFEGHADAVKAVRVHRGRGLAVSAGGDLRIWELASGRCTCAIEGKPDFGSHLAISSDGRLALTAAGFGLPRLWSLPDGQCIRTLPLVAGAVALLEDGSLVITTLVVEPTARPKPDDVREQRPRDDAEEWRPRNQWKVVRLAHRPERARFHVNGFSVVERVEATRSYREAVERARRALAASDYTLAIREIQNARTQPGHEWAPEGVELWGELYRRAQRGELRAVRLTRAFNHQGGECACTQGGAVLSIHHSGEYDGLQFRWKPGPAAQIRVWNTEDGRCAKTFAVTVSGSQFSMPSSSIGGGNAWVSPDGKQALLGLLGNSDAIELWDIETPRRVARFSGHTEPVYALVSSEDGRWVLSGSKDKSARLWDVATGACVHSFEGHESSVTAVCLTPDGSRAITGSWDGTVKVWDLASGRCVMTLFEGPGNVRSLALSADGRIVVAGAAGPALRFWDLNDGRCLRSVDGHAKPVYAVAISADGTTAVSGSHDATAKLWNVADGRCLHTFGGHADKVTMVSLSPDARHLVSADQAGTVRVWFLDWELKERA